MSSSIEGSGGAVRAVEAVYDKFFGGLLILHEDIRSDELWGHMYGLTGEPREYDTVETALEQLSDDGYISPLDEENGHVRYSTEWFDERDHADIVDRYLDEE